MCLFFVNDTATTEIYTYGHTLSLHDALPISLSSSGSGGAGGLGSDSSFGEGNDSGGGGDGGAGTGGTVRRSEEHTSELQSLMRISYAVFCLQKKTKQSKKNTTTYATKTRSEEQSKLLTDTQKTDNQYV